MSRRSKLAIGALFVAGVTLASVLHAGQPVYIGKRMRGTVSVDDVNHSAWTNLLKKHVDENKPYNNIENGPLFLFIPPPSGRGYPNLGW